MSFITSQQYFVAINPLLVKYFRSLTVAAVFERTEYWFSKKENQFYKFIEPCNHPCYREGDSWCEELGITRKVFRKAFEMIGIRYISKTQFDQEQDPFKGKFFAYYFDRKSNKTIFIRNNEAVEVFFQETKLKKTSMTSVKKETTKASPQPGQKSEFLAQASAKESQNIDAKKGRSCTGPLGQSYAYANKDISNNTSNSLSRDKKSLEKNSELSHQMIYIWKDETGEGDEIKTPQKTIQSLPHVLESLFKNSLENWKAYCRKVSSSKFLMGEGSNKDFKIRLSWAIQDRTIERVKANEFGCDRIPPKIQDRKFEINRLLLEKDKLMRESDSLRGDLERNLRNKTKEILENTSLEERALLERDFTEMLSKTEPSYALEFRRKGWKAMFAESRFICYVSEKIFGTVEKSSLYLTKSAELGKRLESIQAELSCVWK